MARITIVSAGHLATCPRMLKAADALSSVGYDVRVVSPLLSDRLTTIDRALHARRIWRWFPVPLGRAQAPARWLLSGGRTRIARRVAAALGNHRPHRIATYAYSRGYTELTNAILQERSDLVYAGTNGAITAALDAAARAGVPCGIDFEDFHCGELAPAGEGELINALAGAVMQDASLRAAFVTAAGEAVARACAERFGREPIVINNVFSLPAPPRRRASTGPLRLYWFSQTIGQGRGLEDVIDAAGWVGLPIELHLRGVPVPGYIEQLRTQAAASAPLLTLTVHQPTDPDAMIGSCDAFDAGLGVEPGSSENNRLVLSNKTLTYPLAGLALVLTGTPGQQPLADTLDGDAIVYEPGNTRALADGLRRWARDRTTLDRARSAAWEAARTRWHWEYPSERDRLLATVRSVV
jgi:glycosyltransferase involved in cell wall biosynthesis